MRHKAHVKLHVLKLIVTKEAEEELQRSQSGMVQVWSREVAGLEFQEKGVRGKGS